MRLLFLVIPLLLSDAGWLPGEYIFYPILNQFYCIFSSDHFSGDCFLYSAVFVQSITVSANAFAVQNNYFNLISNYNICTESSAKVYNRTNCHAELDSASNKISSCEIPNQVRGDKGRIFKKSLYNHLDILYIRITIM